MLQWRKLSGFCYACHGPLYFLCVQEDLLAHLFDPQHVSKLHDPERKSFQDPALLLPLIRPFDRGDSAEIGAGSGYFFFPLAEVLTRRGTCHAVELQLPMIEHFNRELETKPFRDHVRSVLSTRDRIPLSDGSIEVVWMVNVFHELSDPQAIFAEIFRILSPSGQCLVVDWMPEPTPKGPPLEERKSEIDLYDALIGAGFVKIRSHDLYPYQYVVEALKD